MDTSNLLLFRMANRKMDWLAERQKVLAENVANANTPDYMPRDLKELDFKSLARAEMEENAATTHPGHFRGASGKIQAMQTNPGHVAGTIVDHGDYIIETQRQPYETAIDGNGVVLEEQMMKVGETRTNYKFTTDLVRKYSQLIKTALKK